MVHNKISIDRFFEVGGVCELIVETLNEVGVLYPESRDSYLNYLMSCNRSAWIKSERFWWDGWYYEPIGLDDIIYNHPQPIGNFYLFKTEKKG